MKRIGYDADTQRYKFQDEKGVLYESEPGSAYGTLRPIAERDIRKTRPNAFEPSSEFPLLHPFSPKIRVFHAYIALPRLSVFPSPIGQLRTTSAVLIPLVLNSNPELY